MLLTTHLAKVVGVFVKLLKQFLQMQRVMKSMKGGLQQLMGAFKGGMPPGFPGGG